MTDYNKLLPAVLALLALLLFTGANVLAEPVGANVSQIGSPSRVIVQNISTAMNATAGNITELSINGQRVTKYWQGYFGNVSGSIILGTASGFNLYQWSGTVTGEIYASRNDSRINWTGVRCGSIEQVASEDVYLDANSRETADSLNMTFNYTSHPTLVLAGNTISGCRSTPVNGTSSLATGYWNAFLTDNGTNSGAADDDIIIYTSIIDSDGIGFNGNTYDFQMLVAEPGNGTEDFPGGTPTTYFFYVELD